MAAATAMSTEACSSSKRWQVGSSISQLGRIYNSLIRRDNGKGGKSNKHLPLESKSWEGDKEGHGSRERQKDCCREKVD